jgi:glutamyl-tRNA synthetase
MSEVVEIFDIPQILRANARFDLTKLTWLNAEYLREMPSDRFYELSIQVLARAQIDTNKYAVDYLKAALDTCKGKLKVLAELPAYAGFYFKEDVQYDPEAAQRELVPENKTRLKRLREVLAGLEPFNHDLIGAALASVAKEFAVKTGVLVHPTRLACTGSPAGPSLYHLMAILGKDKVLGRLDDAIAKIG